MLKGSPLVFSQADAPQRCLSAYRASETPLADGRLFQKRQSEGKADRLASMVADCSLPVHLDNNIFLKVLS